MTVDSEQRLAKLEGLLARVRERRALPRAARSENGAQAEARPLTLPPEDYDEVVDLSDEDVVEIGESVPPGAVAPSEAPRAPSEAPLAAAASSPSEPELTLSAPEDLPPAHEPESSQHPPAPVAESGQWPSSMPPQSLEAAAPSPSQSFEAGEQLSLDEPLTSEAAPGPGQGQGYGLDFDDEDEEPPASSRRPIASSMDEALADAAAREVPIKTPPPESGPQEAPPHAAGALAEPEVDEALPGASEASHVAQGLPTSAQLGNTVSLDEGGPVDLEIDAAAEAPATESAPAPSDDFEVNLPPREAGGTYDATLAPPPEAKDELEAHRERIARSAPVADTPFRVTSPSPSNEAAGAEELAPEFEATERGPVQSSAVTTITGAPQRFRPGSFLELLDASLKLGQD